MKIYQIALAVSVFTLAVLAQDETTIGSTVEEIQLENDATTIKSASNCNSNLAKQERNKRLVLDFYQELFGDKNISSADNYIDKDSYIQHNPYVADGREALKKGAAQWFKNATRETVDVQHVGADGDLVWLHIKDASHDGKVMSIMHIFRLENFKIVEHWDVEQELPDKAENSHPLF